MPPQASPAEAGKPGKGQERQHVLAEGLPELLEPSWIALTRLHATLVKGARRVGDTCKRSPSL